MGCRYLYLYRSACQVTLETMERDLCLLSSSLIRSTTFCPSASSINVTSINLVLCLPLALVLSVFPSRHFISNSSALSTWPRKCNCLFLLISFISSLLTPALLITSSFAILALHGILIILLSIHISIASSLFIMSFTVHVSLPHNNLDQT